MTLPTFAAQKKAWSSPPVDDIGYIPAKELLAMPDETFVATMTAAIENRYGGWRNYRDRWWKYLLPASDQNKRVLDYGCGIGLEALQYTHSGNRVWVADITAGNLKVTERLFALSGEQLEGSMKIFESAPFLLPPEPLDIVHCVGVLHHIPNAREVVEQMHGWLTDQGQLRLMLYSDAAWYKAVGTMPRHGVPSHDDPNFLTFVHHWDAVGGYADWYDRRKLVDWFGAWFDVVLYRPLTRGQEYVAAVLVKK